jgi:hypothetical protein
MQTWPGEVWLSTDAGTRLKLLHDFESLEYVLSLHEVGACTITLPDTFDTALLRADRRIEVWRQPTDGALQLEDVYFLRRWVDATDNTGRRTISLTGYSGLYLATSRIIASVAGSDGATKSDTADDMLKDFVYESLGGSAIAARQAGTASLSIEADASAAGSITYAAAWQNVGGVLRDLAQAADAAGTAVYYGMVPVSTTQWQFRTRITQLGQDHTFPDGVNPVLLGVEYGNLASPALEWDYTDEVTYVYAGGPGEGTDREVVEVEDTTRSGRSLFGRREAFADARGAASTAAITAVANARLAEGKPRLRFTGSIVDTPGTRYGLAWRWGDRVTATYQGQQYDCLIRAVRVRVDGTGGETIDARLEATE